MYFKLEIKFKFFSDVFLESVKCQGPHMLEAPGPDKTDFNLKFNLNFLRGVFRVSRI